MSAHRILGAEVGPKGWAVRPLKAVRELGSERRETVRVPIRRGRRIFGEELPLVREDRDGLAAGVSVAYQVHGRVAKPGRDNAEGIPKQ